MEQKEPSGSSAVPGSRISRVGIIRHSAKSLVIDSCQKIRRLLEQAGIQVSVLETRHRSGEKRVSDERRRIYEQCDAFVILGGDGTILGVARETAGQGIPILGINLGHFGFLSECTVDELEEAIACLIRGDYQVVKRYMLNARVLSRTSEEVFECLALNEALITRARPGRLLRLSLGWGTNPVLTYRADGLILATPTGSTGHSLSAGGPILEPHLPALVVTPVCPHSLFNRPLVFSGETDIAVRCDDPSDELMLTLDGQVEFRFSSTYTVHLRRSSKTVSTVRFRERSFAEILRYKFNLGET
ncbi:MAG: NAD(+)/NADH kinase [bacterium]